MKTTKSGATRSAKLPPKQVKSRRRASIRRRRPLLHRFLLHPINILVILIAGVLMVGWTFKAIAQQVIVSVVHAPQLSQGAVITVPSSGSAFTSSTITVSGTCPDNSYINLSDNDNFSGSAWCSASGDWQLVDDLYSDQNSLLAQDYNVTDDPGPATAAIAVSYTPPNPVFSQLSSLPSGSSTVASSAPAYPALQVSTNFDYQVFPTNGDFSWTFSISGGVAPYTLLVNWGDGNTSTVIIPNDPTITIQHKYAKPGYFPVIVNVTDAKSQKRIIQLAALISPAGVGGVFNFNNPPPLAGSAKPPAIIVVKAKTWLWLAWPAYAAVVLMLISFWIGERKEYAKIYKKHHAHV